MCKDERPRPEAGGAVDGPHHDHLNALSSLPQDSEAASRLAIRDKLRWNWADVEALTGMSKRWMQREVSAGRMPRPDLNLGRSVGYRPATITAWLDSMADRQGRRSRS
jgi:predicted DNA-binding transcriptional regulator AlpA